MLSQEDYIVIRTRTLKARGVYQKDIAVELGVHPKTVSRALKRGNEPEASRKKRGSKLDPYKAKVMSCWRKEYGMGWLSCERSRRWAMRVGAITVGKAPAYSVKVRQSR